MPTVLKKKKLKLKQSKQKKSIGDKVESYVNSLDMMSLWEEFAHSFNENGTQKYKTVWSFICKTTKNSKERDVLYWLIGPKVVIEKGQVPKYKLDQFDWETKRQQGFWFSSENIEQLSSDIKHKASAYEAVKEAGKVNVQTIAILNSLLKKVLDEFGGSLLLPNLSMKENAFRSQLLLQLIDKITSLSNNAQLMYARTQGLDLERLDQFFQMFGNQMGKTASMLMGNTIEAESETSGNAQLERSFNHAVKMVMNKSLEYNLPLPDDLAAAIKESEEASKPIKKAKVN